MSQRVVTSFLVFAAGAVLVLAYLLPPRIGHPVTPFMESAAENRAGQLVTKLAVEAHRPTVVVFVLPDCPCSIEYEPYVHHVYRAYGDQATFIEVVAGDGTAVEQWKQQQQTPFAVIGDQDGNVAHEFGALRSAYTALVLNGRIVKLWPGYSAGMLHELGGLIAAETKGAAVSLDLAGAPERLTSGCPL